MNLDQVIPVIFLIAVLILVLPGFLSSNSKLKQFIKNLFIWFLIVVSIILISYLSPVNTLSGEIIFTIRGDLSLLRIDSSFITL